MATRRERIKAKRAGSFAARSLPDDDRPEVARDPVTGAIVERTYEDRELEEDYPEDHGAAVGGAEPSALRKAADADGSTFVRESERARAHVRQAPPSERRSDLVAPGAKVGAPTRVLSGRGDLDGAYALVEAAALVTSHDARTFTPRKDYPEGVQERDYQRDPYEQAKVTRNAARLVAAYLVTDNPDSLNGPPVVAIDAAGSDAGTLIVLGGNSRAMSLQRAYADGRAAEYRAALVERSKVFGLLPADLDGMTAPVLVRVVEAERGRWRDLSRALNEGQTQEKSESVDAVSLSHRLSDGTLRLLGEAVDDDETLGAFLASARARGVVAGLWRDGVITQQTGGRYLSGHDLTEAGRDLVARVIVAKLLPDAVLLDEIGPGTRETIARAAPALVGARAAGHDVTDALQDALGDLVDARKRGLSLAQIEAQGSMFALTATRARGREAVALRSLLDGPARRAVRALRIFGRLAQESPAAQGGLPGMDTPRDTAALLDAAIAAAS